MREREIIKVIKDSSKIMHLGNDTKIKYDENNLIIGELLKEIFFIFEVPEKNIIKLIKNRGKLYRNGKCVWVLDVKDLLNKTEVEIFW